MILDILLLSFADPPIDVSKIRWQPNAVTMAGGHGPGPEDSKLNKCASLRIDTDGSIIIADRSNHRIVEWKRGAKKGKIIAGGNGEGNRPNQLKEPSDIIFDKKRKMLYICDRGNGRIVAWSRRQNSEGKTIKQQNCCGLAMDEKYDFLYVTNPANHVVIRYELRETGELGEEKVVAGGNGVGYAMNQLSHPTYIFVDRYNSIYISDSSNGRVMKWLDDAKEGMVVAGSATTGNDRTQLNNPAGLYVDERSRIYVADSYNNRIMLWDEDGISHTIAGRTEAGKGPSELHSPEGLVLDDQKHLYVADMLNHRIQQFKVSA